MSHLTLIFEIDDHNIVLCNWITISFYVTVKHFPPFSKEINLIKSYTYHLKINPFVIFIYHKQITRIQCTNSSRQIVDNHIAMMLLFVEIKSVVLTSRPCSSGFRLMMSHGQLIYECYTLVTLPISISDCYKHILSLRRHPKSPTN